MSNGGCDSTQENGLLEVTSVCSQGSCELAETGRLAASLGQWNETGPASTDNSCSGTLAYSHTGQSSQKGETSRSR